MQKKHIIFVVGPTAAGKTSLAIEIAKKFQTKIISCDSRQCYSELNIGVAKPTEIELQEVEHFFISNFSINEEVNVADFLKYTNEKLELIFKNADVAIIVGGTGLYANAIQFGIDEIPEISEKIRGQIRAEYNEKGLSWLTAALRKEDALYFEKGEMKNPHRMLRALEVKSQTQKSIFDFHQKKHENELYQFHWFGVEIERHLLIKRINERVDIMIKDGLEAEAKTLFPMQELNALQTVGYREWFDFWNGAIKSKDEVISKIKISTRQYAKRQMTWFKKNNNIWWDNANNILKNIDKKIDDKTFS